VYSASAEQKLDLGGVLVLLFEIVLRDYEPRFLREKGVGFACKTMIRAWDAAVE
jgi:hypothetical protein